MAKKRNNSKKMPIHIPNQPLFNNNIWLMFPNVEGLKQVSREHEFQKKLGLRNK